MKRRVRYSDLQVETIKTMHRLGMSVGEIRGRTGISEAFINWVIGGGR